MTAAIPPLRSLQAPPPPSPPAQVAPARAAPAPAPPAGPNPSLRIEPSLGIVVFEVKDGAGEVVRSVPTERELRDYRAAALRGTAEAQTTSPPERSPGSASGAPNPPGSTPPAGDELPARATR